MTVIKAIGPTISHQEAIKWTKRIKEIEWAERLKNNDTKNDTNKFEGIEIPERSDNVLMTMIHRAASFHKEEAFPPGIGEVNVYSTQGEDWEIMFASSYVISEDETEKQWTPLTPGPAERDLFRWLEEKQGVTCVPDTFLTYPLTPEQATEFDTDTIPR